MSVLEVFVVQQIVPGATEQDVVALTAELTVGFNVNGWLFRQVRLNRVLDVIADERPGLLTDAVLEVALRGILVVVAQRARDEELGAQAQGLVLKLPGGGSADLALRAELIDGELSEGRAGGARPVHRGELAVVPDVGLGELNPRRGVLDRAGQ